MGTSWERHVGDLPAFGVFLLPAGVPGSLLPEACQSQMQVVSVKQTTFVMDEEKFIILVQGRECLYNLQHNDYDNNLVKDNCWKEIAGEWQGHGRVAAGKRHGNGMLCVNRALTRQRNDMVCVNRPLADRHSCITYLPVP
jgi:hypothetical protein